MVKKQVAGDGRSISFVKVSNAGMMTITLKQVIELYTKYANMILEVNSMRKEKAAKLKQLKKKISEIETMYDVFVGTLPKKIEEKPKQLPVEKPKPVKDVEVVGIHESFDNLRAEFERIRQELENIK